MPRVNEIATEARNAYREFPYVVGWEPGEMYGGFSVTRDADALDRSNFDAACRAYESARVEYRRDGFNHWLVGWIDHLVVPISRASVGVLVELVEQVQSYPVLNDELFDEYEWADDHPADGRCYSQFDDCGCGKDRP